MSCCNVHETVNHVAKCGLDGVYYNSVSGINPEQMYVTGKVIKPLSIIICTHWIITM